MATRSLKLQAKLTLQLSVIFIGIAVFTFFYFTRQFEEQIKHNIKYKTTAVVNYIVKDASAFKQNKFSDPNLIRKLLDLNNMLYLVFENDSGKIQDAVNFEVAEKNFYVKARTNFDELSDGENLYRLSVPINTEKNKGKMYIGIRSENEYEAILKYKFITGLFCLAIIVVGMVITYFFTALLISPLTRINKALEAISSSQVKYTPNTRNQLRVISDRVSLFLTDYKKASAEVDALSKRLNDLFKDKIVELNLEINQRKKVEISLQKSEEQFRLVFQNAPIGIVIIATDGKILSVNKSFCDTTGFNREEIIGLHIKFLFEKNYLEGFSEERSEAYEIPIANINSEKILLRKEGNEINVLIKSVAVLNEKNKVIHYVMQVLDISEIKKAQKELVEALNKAEESDKLKSAFLAQMSHEIRTPLNVILTSIPLIAEEIPGDDEELKMILDSVKSAGRRLQRTIDMILSMSSVQSGNYKPTYEKFDIVPDIQNLVNEFKSLTDDKGLKLKFNKGETNSFVIADRYTVNQVFQNIINNAIKYTLKGHVEVSVKNLKDDKVLVEIKDTGIGMSKDYLQKMFVPFSQEDAGHKRQFEGNGLGLALVKKYLELNRAEISVQSEKNVGSTFSVIFDKKINFVEAAQKEKALKTYH